MPWDAIIVAVAVLFTGWRIIVHIDAMSINLGNGSNGIHSMVYEKLTTIEEMTAEQKETLAGAEDHLGRIEQHVRPELEMSPEELHAKLMLGVNKTR